MMRFREYLLAMLGLAATLAYGDKCCEKKKVGDKSYTLVESGGDVYINCPNSCVYSLDDDPTKKFCFAPGNLTSTCTGSSCQGQAGICEEEEEEEEEIFKMCPGCRNPGKPWCTGRCMQGGRKCIGGRCVKKPSNDVVDHPEDFVSGSGSEIGCPALSDLSTTMIVNGEKQFRCARFYQGFGGKYSITSCHGNRVDIHDGYTTDGGTGKYYAMGSILVMPGCKMYMFETTPITSRTGVSYVYDTGVHFDNPYWKQNTALPSGPRSYICSCQQQFPSCTASDGWEDVITCDNSKNLESPVDCSYTYDVGTTYSETITTTITISATISAEIGASFEGLFHAGGSGSLTTGYDFSTAYDFSQTTSKTITIDSSVPAGYSLAVQQAVGYCGDSKFKTNMFRFVEQQVTGPNVTFERAKIEFA